MTRQGVRLAALALFVGRAWTSCESDDTCDTVDTSSPALIQSKRAMSRSKALWPATYIGQECCGSDNCDQSTKFGNYVSAAECQQKCTTQSSCIGIEYGNHRSDSYDRCAASDQCFCYIVGGACSSRNSHPGYSIYLKASTAATTPAATTAAACNWVQYLGDKTKCQTLENGKDGGFQVADQAACQKAAEDAGHQFYQYTTALNGFCNTQATCDSPKTGTSYNWKIFQCQDGPPGEEPLSGSPPGEEPLSGPPPGEESLSGPPPGEEPLSGPPPGEEPLSGPPPGEEPLSGPPPGEESLSGPPPGEEPLSGPPPGEMPLK